MAKILFPTIVTSSALVAAWVLIESPIALSSACIAAFGVMYLLHLKRHALLSLFLTGVLVSAIGGAWIPSSIQAVSDFGILSTAGLFALFVILNALLFPLVRCLFTLLPSWLDHYALRGSLAWVAIELIPLRLFPWTIGHMYLDFVPLVQVAELGGTILVSFVVLWFAEAFVLWKYHRQAGPHLYIATVVLIVSLLFGLYRQAQYSKPPERTLSIAAIQPGDLKDIPPQVAIETLISETAKLNPLPELVIWPELAFPYEMHESVFRKKNEPRFPDLPYRTDLLFGARTYRLPKKRFNSAVLLKRDGTIPIPYHKIDLMPHGEYIPFGMRWLANPRDGVTEFFTRGKERKIFELRSESDRTPVKIAPIICYEDILSMPGQEATLAGAELIVSLTNDRWLKGFASYAMMQHNTLARMRSIETRRTLVRATTSGMTAVIDPLGRVQAELPLQERGALRAAVGIHDEKTLFVALGGTNMLRTLLYSLLLLLILSRLVRR